MNAEPQKSSRSESAFTPMWLIVLFAGLVYGGLVYLDHNSGGFNANVYAPYKSDVDLAAMQPSSGGPSPYVLGAAVYNKPTCVSCHQASLAGVPGQFPPLAGSDWVLEPEPGRIIRIVLNGLNGPIEVKGVSYNNAMVPWKDVLSDEEIAGVLTYVRQNKDCGNNAPAVTPEQVKAVREKIKNRNTPFTADELKKISPAE
jgi:mono/diheme cytochrome c family protein